MRISWAPYPPFSSADRYRMVGVTGFGPAISCSQGRRDDQASLHPIDKAGVLLRQRGGSNRSPVTRSRRSQCPTPWRMAAFRPTFQPFRREPRSRTGCLSPPKRADYRLPRSRGWSLPGRAASAGRERAGRARASSLNNGRGEPVMRVTPQCLVARSHSTRTRGCHGGG